MKKLLYLTILILNSNLHAQTFGLKVLSISDSSLITKDLRLFDSMWHCCLSNYGKKDVSNLFADSAPTVSKTNPITLLNFITGIDVPLFDVFGFKLVNSQILNDSILLYHLDMGWLQLAIPFNRIKKKLMRFESINFFDLNKFRYKNLTVYSMDPVKQKDLDAAFKKIVQTAKEIDINIDSFIKREIVIYSGRTIKESYSYVGGLEYVNYFNKGSIYGGMGDPFNNLILSGIPKPIHIHELLHFLITFPCNQFIGEGLASYYGGIGATSYTNNLQKVLKIIKKKDIHSFTDLNILWRTDNYFNSVRGTYILAAFMLSKIKKEFNLKTYRNFVRHCQTDSDMIINLKDLYQVDSEKVLFDKLFWEKMQ
jgi:hypothetical protein